LVRPAFAKASAGKMTTFDDFRTTFDDFVTIVVAGAQRFCRRILLDFNGLSVVAGAE